MISASSVPLHLKDKNSDRKGEIKTNPEYFYKITQLSFLL
jgi:hypothetical protein